MVAGLLIEFGGLGGGVTVVPDPLPRPDRRRRLHARRSRTGGGRRGVDGEREPLDDSYL